MADDWLRTENALEFSSKSEIAAVDFGKLLCGRVWTVDVPFKAVDKVHRSNDDVELTEEEGGEDKRTIHLMVT